MQEGDGCKMTSKRITVRFEDDLLKALELYCERNFADQSTVIRTALAQWPPVQKILEEFNKKKGR